MQSTIRNDLFQNDIHRISDGFHHQWAGTLFPRDDSLTEPVFSGFGVGRTTATKLNNNLYIEDTEQAKLYLRGLIQRTKRSLPISFRSHHVAQIKKHHQSPVAQSRSPQPSKLKLTKGASPTIVKLMSAQGEKGRTEITPKYSAKKRPLYFEHRGMRVDGFGPLTTGLISRRTMSAHHLSTKLLTLDALAGMREQQQQQQQQKAETPSDLRIDLFPSTASNMQQLKDFPMSVHSIHQANRSTTSNRSKRTLNQVSERHRLLVASQMEKRHQERIEDFFAQKFASISKVKNLMLRNNSTPGVVASPPPVMSTIRESVMLTPAKGHPSSPKLRSDEHQRTSYSKMLMNLDQA